tara:strand:- start:64 stop:324 length:261 start_codon:yes stop_codon:yes gene_type:complete
MAGVHQYKVVAFVLLIVLLASVVVGVSDVPDFVKGRRGLTISSTEKADILSEMKKSNKVSRQVVNQLKEEDGKLVDIQKVMQDYQI